MELKRCACSSLLFAGLLLIVPYGIETQVVKEAVRECQGLLIVPYGIETNSRDQKQR